MRLGFIFKFGLNFGFAFSKQLYVGKSGVGDDLVLHAPKGGCGFESVGRSEWQTRIPYDKCIETAFLNYSGLVEGKSRAGNATLKGPN